MSENGSEVIMYDAKGAKEAFIHAFGIKSDAYSMSQNNTYQTDGNRVFGKMKYQIISLEDAINALKEGEHAINVLTEPESTINTLNEAEYTECKITALTKPGKKLDVKALEKMEDAGISVGEIPYKYQSIRPGSYQVKAIVNVCKFLSVEHKDIQKYLEYFTEPWDIELETNEFCIKLEDLYCGKWAGLEILQGSDGSYTIEKEHFDKLLKGIGKTVCSPLGDEKWVGRRWIMEVALKILPESWLKS